MRCYQCKFYKEMFIRACSGKCMNPKYDKVIKVDAVDFCEKGEDKDD